MKTSVLRGMQYKDLSELERQLTNRLRETPRNGNYYDILDLQTNIAWIQKVREEKRSDSKRESEEGIQANPSSNTKAAAGNQFRQSNRSENTSVGKVRNDYNRSR